MHNSSSRNLDAFWKALKVIFWKAILLKALVQASYVLYLYFFLFPEGLFFLNLSYFSILKTFHLIASSFNPSKMDRCLEFFLLKRAHVVEISETR